MKKIYLTAVCAILLAVGANAQTDQEGRSTFPQPREILNSSEYKPHVGLLVGHSDPEGSGNINPELGIDVGYQPYYPFGLSAQFVSTNLDTGFEMQDRNTLWLQGTYNLGGTIPVIRDSYVGAAAGAVFIDDRAVFGAAPVLGFDIPLTNINDQGVITLGATAKYAIVTDDEFDAASAYGVLKYWY